MKKMSANAATVAAPKSAAGSGNKSKTAKVRTSVSEQIASLSLLRAKVRRDIKATSALPDGVPNSAKKAGPNGVSLLKVKKHHELLSIVVGEC